MTVTASQRIEQTSRAFYGYEVELRKNEDPFGPGRSLEQWREWIRLLWLMRLAKDHPLAAALVQSVEVIQDRHELQVMLRGRFPAVDRDRGLFGGSALIRIENLLCGVLNADQMVQELARHQLRELECYLVVRAQELM